MKRKFLAAIIVWVVLFAGCSEGHRVHVRHRIGRRPVHHRRSVVIGHSYKTPSYKSPSHRIGYKRPPMHGKGRPFMHGKGPGRGKGPSMMGRGPSRGRGPGKGSSKGKGMTHGKGNK
jgi:hypothetical protein